MTAFYTYNGDNLRQTKTVNGVTTRHVYNGQNIIYEEINGTAKAAYHRLGDRIISSRLYADSTAMYYVYNGQGNISQLFYINNTLAVDYTYDAFGYKSATNEDVYNPFRYNGEYLDEETGYTYLRNRYYDSDKGRFINEDPIKSGLNWYAYCENNPVNMIDPLGEDAIILTNNEAAANFGHTSAIYQDENGDWFYTYWGNKAAAVIRISDEYMGSLDDFNSGLNKFLSDNGFTDITSDYDKATCIVGDFTESLNAAYTDVN